MITNRDCFFNKKSDFVNRLTELSPNSVVYIADTQQIWTQNKYFECAMTSDKVKELIEAHGYLTSDDIPNLTGGATASTGQFVNKVTGDGHKLVVGLGNFSEVTVGKANQLTTARTITLSGDVSGSASFNGASNITINTTVADNSHSHLLNNISNLNGSWAGLLDDAPSSYVTRWPTISEVTGKQSLVIKLNSGTTEGTNMFTFNGTTSKSVNITPGTIGAPTTSGTGATGTWAINISGNAATSATSDSLTMDTNDGSYLDEDNIVPSNGKFAVGVCNTSGTSGGNDGYIMAFRWRSNNFASQIFIDADSTGIMALRHRNSNSVWSDWLRILTSGNIGNYALTPSNYSTTLDTRYVKKSGDTITGPLTMSGTSIVWNDVNVNWNSDFGGLRVLRGTTTNVNTPIQYCVGLNIDNGYKFQLASHGGGGNKLYYRGYNGNNGTWDPWVTIWHSGNDGSDSTLDADLLDGQHGSWYQNNALRFRTIKNASENNPIDLNIDLNNGGFVRNYNSKYSWINGPEKLMYGSAISFISDSSGALNSQFVWDVNHNVANATKSLWFRASNHLGWDKNWHQIAFTTSNVDSASKLQTARTISLSGDVTGRASFDGSQNITINTTVGNASHTHTLANISDLQASWDAILKAAPTAQVTRWPSISEVTGKQNLTIRLNGGTTEGTNQFTYNGTAAKTVNINPSSIGASSSSHTHNTSISSNATTNLSVTAGGTTDTIADLYATYADQLRTARTISLTGDVTGSVSFNGSKDVSITTTVKDDSHSHSNYANKDGSNASGTWGINISGNAASATKSATREMPEGTDLNTLGAAVSTVGFANYYKSGGISVDNAPSDISDAAGLGFITWRISAGFSAQLLAATSGGNAAGMIFRKLNSNDNTVLRDWAVVLDSLNVDNYALTRSNYTSYTVTKTGGGASGTWGINISGNAASASSVTWANIDGKPSTFTPSSHTHTIAQISNLASSWDDVLINQGVRSRSMTFNGTNYTCYTAAANTSNMTWYAPTTAGTSGYILQSTGGAPKWISRATLQHELFTAGVGCTAIPANADLNDYQTPGNYYCSYNATVVTMSNTPSSNAFNLEVREAAGVIQIFREYGYSSNRKDFIRGYYQGTWTAWKELAVTSDIPSLSGYATQSWVNSQSFAKTSDIPSLDGYATQSWVSSNFQVPLTLNSTSAALSITKIGDDTYQFSMNSDGLGNLIEVNGTSNNAYNLRLNINGKNLTINDLYATRIGNYAISVVDSLPTTLATNTIYFVY